MTTRTWNGSNDLFNNAADWSGGAVPVAGDTAVINSGQVVAQGPLTTPLTITMDGTNGPTFVFAGAELSAGSLLLANDETNFVSLIAGGTSINAGGIKFSGGSGGAALLQIEDSPMGAASSFINNGGISIVGQDGSLQNTGTNSASDIVNNGIISIRNGGTTGIYTYSNIAIDGTGTIRVQPNANLQLGREVGSGQTVEFEAGSGNSSVLLTDAAQFNGTISGFGSADQIVLTSSAWDAYTYAINGGVGTFTFTASGAPVATVNIAGGYPQSDFAVSGTGGGAVEQTTLTTSVPNQPSRISFTDTATDVSGNEGGTPYTGPVAGLQYQYLWSSSDSVAISASVPNVFLKGGAGGDALLANSGNNVLDGGGGSNFLVGGTGAGQDTFYVDGRGGVVTWSTIVNFHEGDQVTLFGFQSGTSTLPLTTNDGTPGYTGVTIHSELNGAGTGVNESLTLTGLTTDTVSNHMTITTGTLSPGTSSALPYLLIQYDH